MEKPPVLFFGLSGCQQVSWGHAVNTFRQLQEEIKMEKDMLEVLPYVTSFTPKSDIRYDKVKCEPVMAHDAIDYNKTYLPFRDWLQEVTGPVWLNADILVGPNGGYGSPIPPKEFLTACDSLPGVTLSLGWTTGLAIGSPGYTLEMVKEMLALCGHLESVTFPIRCSHVPRSLPALEMLLGHRKGYTLTLWTGKNDFNPSMEWLKEHLDMERVYVDLPNGPSMCELI